jgi:hypothetical protein
MRAKLAIALVTMAVLTFLATSAGATTITTCQTCYQTCWTSTCEAQDACGATYTYGCGTSYQCNPYQCNCTTTVVNDTATLYPCLMPQRGTDNVNAYQAGYYDYVCAINGGDACWKAQDYAYKAGVSVFAQRGTACNAAAIDNYNCRNYEYNDVVTDSCTGITSTYGWNYGNYCVTALQKAQNAGCCSGTTPMIIPTADVPVAQVTTNLAAAVGNGGDSKSVACGYSTGAWNAPNGAVVASTSPGIVAAVVMSLGEFRSHVALSHGAEYASHNAMVTPKPKLTCDEPLEPGLLANGYPGASRVPVNSMYTFYFNDPEARTPPEYMSYQVTGNLANGLNAGAEVANYFNVVPKDLATNLGCVNVQERWSAKGGSAYRYYTYIWPSDEAAQHSNKYMSYRVNEYVNGENGNQNLAGTCSAFIAYMQKKALGVGWEPTVEHFAQDKVRTALGKLWDGVRQSCKSEAGWFKLGLSQAWCSLKCGTIFNNNDDMCERMATQVAYCFTSDVYSDNCSNGCHSASDAKNKPVADAKAISPDRLMGYHGQAKGMYNPATGAWDLAPINCNVAGSGNSLWACDTQKSLTWNTGGNIYGCWY